MFSPICGRRQGDGNKILYEYTKTEQIFYRTHSLTNLKNVIKYCLVSERCTVLQNAILSFGFQTARGKEGRNRQKTPHRTAARGCYAAGSRKEEGFPMKKTWKLINDNLERWVMMVLFVALFAIR